MNEQTIGLGRRPVSFTVNTRMLEGAAVTSLLDSRDGHHSWSLYGNSGSQPIQSTGFFDPRDTDHYGMEGAPPNKAGASRDLFHEAVKYFVNEGTITFDDGTVQKISGYSIIMHNAIQLWSGELKKNGEKYDTPASAQYYIALTIRRQRADKKFHLLTSPIFHGFKDGGDVVGSHKLRVYNESQNALLWEQVLTVSSDPHSNASFDFETSDVVGQKDFLKVEVVAQIALANSNSPVNPVVGGSMCGIGFLDNVG
jgi:hypothetical protein